MSILWRQGDLLIQQIDEIPPNVRRCKRLVLAQGDATGHKHQIKDAKSARLYTSDRTLFVDVIGDEATIVHPEHGPIQLGRGKYKVWRQHEFTVFGLTTIGD